MEPGAGLVPKALCPPPLPVEEVPVRAEEVTACVGKTLLLELIGRVMAERPTRFVSTRRPPTCRLIWRAATLLLRDST